MALDIVQKIKYRKLNLSDQMYCRMPADRLLKQVVLGITVGSNRRERARKRWTDDEEEWCNHDLHNLRKRATGRTKWQQSVKHALIRALSTSINQSFCQSINAVYSDHERGRPYKRIFDMLLT